ncbi:LuxR C-terminal-related transcriptional regulator [Porticoccus sp. W117]|uniref:LuxR C-terminal-related transcriptional regulator n=1 Tax=Porticoccus sp. W117 TaxID=3054777 RepID=UPI002595F9A6|nr:LuxR C-terminal-related transcriptional regulator [Porticoccus sp. W117]MDM3871595.1 LuxR C-terminal-related transcriptional regulator [Porticoccus sp. W117]
MRSDLDVFSEAVASLLPTLGSDSFPGQLVAVLKRLVSFNNALVLLYRKNQKPLLAYNDLPSSEREVNVVRFMEGAYLLDPCFRAIADNEVNGFYRLKNIVPNGFGSSEYYRSYYRYTGLTDEFGYNLSLGEGIGINIALGRTQTSQGINRRDVQVLEEITPLIAELCRQHWGQKIVNGDNTNLPHQLESALDNFGRSILTDRETQVVQLFLHGHSTRSIAEKLGISPETVKLHRKNSYAKLDVCSQAELFYLFIDSLSSLENYTGGDPLVGYLTHSK